MRKLPFDDFKEYAKYCGLFVSEPELQTLLENMINEHGVKVYYNDATLITLKDLEECKLEEGALWIGTSSAIHFWGEDAPELNGFYCIRGETAGDNMTILQKKDQCTS